MGVSVICALIVEETMDLRSKAYFFHKSKQSYLFRNQPYLEEVLDHKMRKAGISCPDYLVSILSKEKCHITSVFQCLHKHEFLNL